MTEPSSDGSATVEHVALAALVALLAIAAISALVANPPKAAQRELGRSIARRIACSPRLPDPCNRNPLALAYGFPLGKLVRYLAPPPSPRAGLVPVDFRRCRRPTCAAPGRPGLTSANRRITAFTQIDDRRRRDGSVRITYWLYRPGRPWEAVERRGGAAEIATASALRLRVSDVPALVPLETLPGHNHYDFPAIEEPPWRWKI